MSRLHRQIAKVLLLSTLLCGAGVTGASAQVSDELIEKGQRVGSDDPSLTELREQQGDDAARRGFDAALALTEGQTEWGPGKQAFLERLERDERPGFLAGAHFVVDRNKNKERAAAGAAVAAGDPDSESGRMSDSDVRFRLGFDIASGIFGDPALGAQGNTEWGPGSTGIRNALSPVSQRGFDAAAKLHLGRRGKPGASARAPAASVAGNLRRRVPLPNQPKPDSDSARGDVPAERVVSRAAKLVGIGGLSLGDEPRRTGFDLDQGRYEEIYRGADLVMRHLQPEPFVEQGRTYYQGGGIHILPSDGATISEMDGHMVGAAGIGNAAVYDRCRREWKAVSMINIQNYRSSESTTFCVRTSSGKLAAVEFRVADRPSDRAGNWKFRFAYFGDY